MANLDFSKLQGEGWIPIDDAPISNKEKEKITEKQK